MIIGIGIDSVDIHRFADWHAHTDRFLLRIFSHEEITYCRSNIQLSAQRFAVRFAAREALFKALSQAIPHHSIPFLTLCRAVTITKKESKVPRLDLHWQLINSYGISDSIISPNKIQIWLSLTHSKSLATAWVILEKNL